MNLRKSHIAYTLALLAISTSAHSAIITFEAIADTYGRSDQATTTAGSSGVMLIGDFGASGNSVNANAYINFDLSDPVLTGATINSVTLTLHKSDSNGGSANLDFTISAYELLQPFSEYGATWNNRDGSNA